MALKMENMGPTTEQTAIKPEDRTTPEQNARAARNALLIAQTPEEAGEFLGILGVDPKWLKDYVTTNGWPK